LRAEAAEVKNKAMEQLLIEKDHDLLSLTHKLDLATGELEKAETELAKYKQASLDGEQSKTTSEGLSRKVQLLEEELDAAEKNLKETVEKCAVRLAYLVCNITHISFV
jgi:tropomyosin